MTSANIFSGHSRLASGRTSASSPKGLLYSFAALAWRVLTWPARVAAARAAMTQLSRMTDHELRDIGLSRQDLRDASALVADADPTELLAQRAAGRRWWPR